MKMSEYDEKVENLFKRIIHKLDERSNSQGFRSLKMRSTMYQKARNNEDGQQRNITKSVFVKRYDNHDDSVEKRNSPQSAIFRSTFVNIKNARYQLEPMKDQFRIKNLEFPNFGKKTSIKKIKPIPKDVIQSIDLFKSSQVARKKTSNVKQSWNRSNIMGSIHLKRLQQDKGVYPSVGRRVLKRKFDKTEQNIEGWKPSPSFIEEDHQNSIIKLM